jgi:hypothetical protein
MGAVKCLACGQLLVSKSRHDCQTCGCPQGTMVDGGNDYFRAGGKEMSKVQHLHDILLEPLAESGIASVPEKPYKVDSDVLCRLVLEICKIVDTFPENYALVDERRKSPFSEEVTDAVVNIRSALVDLRDIILKQKLADAAKAAAKNQKSNEDKG